MSQGWASRHARGPAALAGLALAAPVVALLASVTGLPGPAAGLLCPAAAAAEWRFDTDAPPLTRVADDRPIPPPAVRGWNEIENFVDDHWRWPVADLLSGRGRAPAQDLNALDEVPLSTWFAGGAPPTPPAAWAEGHGPLTVEAGRVAGDEPYLVLRDARGKRFLCLFDRPERPQEQTGAALISSRLLAAAGYPALAGSPGTIARGDLVLAPDARAVGEFGGGGRLSATDLDRFCGGETRRVAAFDLPAGRILGGFRERGVRPDDPNDRIDHENRRSLRGLAPLCAWLDWRRIDEAHTLDLHLEEGGFVRHYLAQLGSTLGVLDREPAFGLQGFDPLAWQPRRPYAPFEALGWGDLLWGIERMLSIPPRAIEEAVRSARLGDPGQARWLAGTLLERRERVARAWLGRVNGAVDLRLEERAPGRWLLTCADLAARAQLRRAQEVSFAMTLRWPETGEVAGMQTRGGAEPAFDLTPFRPPSWAHRLDPRRYAIAEIRAWDHAGRELAGCARVHLYFDGEAGPRIVGIVRD